jgi:hypothetical protein
MADLFSASRASSYVGLPMRRRPFCLLNKQKLCDKVTPTVWKRRISNPFIQARMSNRPGTSQAKGDEEFRIANHIDNANN